MPRPLEYRSYQDLLQYFIAIYYSKREEHPGIKLNPAKHKRLIKEIDEKYRFHLAKKFPEWDTEQGQKQFIEEINFLTGVLKGSAIKGADLLKDTSVQKAIDKIFQ